MFFCLNLCARPQTCTRWVFDYANFSPQSVTDLANVLFSLVAASAEKMDPFENRLTLIHLINDILNLWCVEMCHDGVMMVGM